MRKHLLILAFAAALAMAVSLPGADRVSADNGKATIEYFIGTLPFANAPNISESANGDTIEVIGRGSFSLDKDGRISGRGSWSHRNAAGVLLARGTWTARRLLSYETYGPQEAVNGFVLPRGSEGGLALIGVRMRPDGRERAFDAFFAVDCLLGDEVQDGAHEGTTVDPTTGLAKRRNFNEKLEGLTLFVRHDDD